MSFYGYEKFYVNGCSHSQGGGLEGPELKKDSVFEHYRDMYGITEWKDRSELNFAYHLSKLMGIPYVNDAESGGGTERVVRMAYEWIWENWEIKDKIFLILENPDPSRFEVFYSPLKEYFILNSNNDADTGFRKYIFSTRGYFRDKTYDEDYKLQAIFQKWFNNHADITENYKRIERDFVGLYSFCKMNGIRIFLMTPNNVMFKECFQKEDVIKFVNDEKNYDISSWAFDARKTIKDDLDGKSQDMHPGYFAHIEYAKILKDYIEEKFKNEKNN